MSQLSQKKTEPRSLSHPGIRSLDLLCSLKNLCRSIYTNLGDLGV